MKIEYREIEVKGATLRGFFTRPDGEFKDIVVMLHGFTGHKNEHGFMFKELSLVLAEHGIASLRYDYRGSGDSDLPFCMQSFTTVVEDGSAAVEDAVKLNGGKPVIVLGFSMGGANAARQTVNHGDLIKKAILISPSGKLGDTLDRIFSMNPVIDDKYVDMGGYLIGIDFKHSLEGVNLYENVETFKKPVLIIQGTKDTSVYPQDSKIYSDLYPDCKYVLVEGATHGYDSIAYHKQYHQLILDFLK